MRVVCISPWPEPSLDIGHEIRSVYVEHHWLPSLGPTSYLFLRQAAFLLDASPTGATETLEELAELIGVGSGTHGALPRAMGRLARFGFLLPITHATTRGPVEHLAVRRYLPDISPKHLRRLPARRQDELRVQLNAR